MKSRFNIISAVSQIEPDRFQRKLGEIRDYFGNLIEVIFAQDEAVILILSPTLSAHGGNVAMHARYNQYI